MYKKTDDFSRTLENICFLMDNNMTIKSKDITEFIYKRPKSAF
jgi:hypothetical protein